METTCNPYDFVHRNTAYKARCRWYICKLLVYTMVQREVGSTKSGRLIRRLLTLPNMHRFLFRIVACTVYHYNQVHGLAWLCSINPLNITRLLLNTEYFIYIYIFFGRMRHTCVSKLINSDKNVWCYCMKVGKKEPLVTLLCTSLNDLTHWCIVVANIGHWTGTSTDQTRA